MNSDVIKKAKEVTCLKCKRVSFEVSLEFAKNEVKRFNAYFDSLSLQKQLEDYRGRKTSLENYKKCSMCGGSYKNFRPAIKGDCPEGVTISAILARDA